MINLFLAELRRQWMLRKRYSVETISLTIGLTIIFYGLFQSAQYIAGPTSPLSGRLGTIIVGYVLWSLSLFILADIAGELQQEAQTGTLEQIFLSPFRAYQIFIIRALANLTIQLVLTLSILLIILAITGSHLFFPLTLLLPLFTVLLGAYGLALATGSLALILKRVQQVLGIFQFLLFLILTMPIENWSGTARLLSFLLPMAPGATLLRAIMARGQALDLTQFLIALLNGTAYFILGLFLFRLAEVEAKRRGKLGGY